MAQASTKISRRNLISSASAVAAGAAFATPAIASAVTATTTAGADDRIFELERKLIVASARLDSACRALSRAERTVTDWMRRNPKPTAYAIFPAGRTETTSWRELDAWSQTAKDKQMQWEKRKRTAEGNCGLAAMEANEKAAGDEVSRLVDDLCDARARTVAGITAKARAAWRTGSDNLHYSATEDLIRLSPDGEAFMAAA